METADVAVIGAGPGGYSAAIRLAQAGLSTVCIEKEAVGGVCLNWGCIPSKALISVAERYQKTLHGDTLGISAGSVTLDMQRAQSHNRNLVKHHTGGVIGLLKANGVEVVRGHAKVASARRVTVDTGRAGLQEIEVSRGIVISTGAKPRLLAGLEPDGRRVLSAKEAVFLEEVPQHLIVVGGGVIGMELGSAFLNLGAKLTVVEVGPTLLPGVDEDLVAVVRKRLSAKGAALHLGCRVTAFDRTDERVRLELTSTGERVTSIEGTHVLVAAGFIPDTTSLGVEQLGLRLDERGHIATGDDCQTSVQGVYAIGDVAGPPYLAHKAFAEALVVADALSGKRTKRDWKAMPSAIFTDPEIATVGMTEAQARAAGIPLDIGRFPYSALGRAGAQGETEGFIKLLSVDGRLTGAGLVGVYASELIAELTLAIEVGATLEDLSLTVHPHPTLSEGIHDAAEHGLGHAVHVLNKSRRSS